MPKTLLVSLLLLLCASACSGGGSSPDDPPAPPARERIVIGGAGDLGIFDPAITRDPVTSRLWMSYSSIETSSYYPSTTYWAVSIRLAWSDDNGASWTDAGTAVSPATEDIVGPMAENHPFGDIPAGSQGIWQSETSAIIYDPGAPLAERWKLIWFQYLNANLTSFFADHSWIAMKTAPSALGLLAAPTVKLFGGAGLQTDGSNTGPPVFSPLGGMPAFQLNTDLTSVDAGADLNDLTLCVFAEPGLHATNSALYLAIFCADASTSPITEYLVYFRCPSPCNTTSAASWEYVGRLLTPADALAATGDDHYQAPALVEKNGNTYLLVTPVDTSVDNRYNGCRLYEMVDVDGKALVRNAGQLVEQGRIDGFNDSHNGACAAFDAIDGGIMLSQFEVSKPSENFNMYKSQSDLP